MGRPAIPLCTKNFTLVSASRRRGEDINASKVAGLRYGCKIDGCRTEP